MKAAIIFGIGIGLAAPRLGGSLGLTIVQSPPTSPTHGIILEVRYGVDQKGRVISNSKRTERIIFSGVNTRRETLDGSKLVSADITGTANWIAYLDAGRIYDQLNNGIKTKSFPQNVRDTFDKVFSKRERTGTGTVLGLPCWIYRWHEPARMAGDVGSGPQDVAYWVYVNKDFPLVLRYD